MPAESRPQYRLLYTVNDAAAELGCSRWSIYRLIEQRKLEAVPFGANSRRVTGESLRKLAQTGVPVIRDTSADPDHVAA